MMVDSQPYTGRRFSGEAAMPQVVIDHHDTGGLLAGVLFYDIRAGSRGTHEHDCGFNYLQSRRMLPVSPNPTPLRLPLWESNRRSDGLSA